jgi:hypothetical protein
MSKLKLFLVTALATASIGVAGLATAPSASALPPRGDCQGLVFQAISAQMKGDQAWNLGHHLAAYCYWALAAGYAQQAEDCFAGA